MIGMGRRHRRLDDGELIDRAALLRIRETDHSPPGLSPTFLAQVRALDQVPDSMRYES